MPYNVAEMCEKTGALAKITKNILYLRGVILKVYQMYYTENNSRKCKIIIG